MFKRIYRVKGEDVNDFMVMQNASYLCYSSKLVDAFLFEKGFTKLKMNSLKVGFQKSNDQVKHYRDLMFTESFSVDLKCKVLDFCKSKMNIEVHFYNKQKQLCTIVSRELLWFDYVSWQTITPSKKISKYFIGG